MNRRPLSGVAKCGANVREVGEAGGHAELWVMAAGYAVAVDLPARVTVTRSCARPATSKPPSSLLISSWAQDGHEGPVVAPEEAEMLPGTRTVPGSLGSIT